MSYSFSNYKLQLPDTGTEAGTWGTIVNTNMGSTISTYQGIEQAIGGYSSVSFSSASETLAYSNITGNQNFRSLYINCTGTPGAAATLTVPAIQKMYIVKNGTTGGYNITVKIGASTGTVVPNGKTMLLYANGTDVILVHDYIGSLGVGSLDVTGALTVGGNGTFSGSNTIGNAPVEFPSASWSVAATTATIDTTSAHGFTAGQFVTLSFTATSPNVAPPNGRYQINATPLTNTFTVTIASGSGAGSVAVYQTKRVTMNSDFYTDGSAGTSGQFLTSQGTDQPPAWGNTASSITVTGNASVGGNATVTGTLAVTGAATFGNNTTLGAAEIVYTPASWTFSTTNTVQVTYNNHGFQNGDLVTINFGAGTGTIPDTAQYTVANAATNTFTITFTGTTGSGSAATIYKANIATLNSQVYDANNSAGTTGQTLISQGTGRPPLWSAPIALASGGNNTLVTANNAFTAVAGSGTTLYPATFNRAFVNFDPTTDRTIVTGSYSWVTTTLTINSTAHGFRAGDIVWLKFTSGTASGSANYWWWFVIASVTTDAFVINTTGVGSGNAPGGTSFNLTTAGNYEYYIYNPPTPSYSNVRRVVIGNYYTTTNLNEYAILFNTAAPDTRYSWYGSAAQGVYATNQQNYISAPYYYAAAKSLWKSTNYLLVGALFAYNSPASSTPEDVSVVVTF